MSKILLAFLRHEENVDAINLGRHYEAVNIFCKKIEVEPDELFNRSREEHYVRIRSLFCYWCELSCSELAELFKMHHSSILHYYDTHKERLMYDKQYQNIYKRAFS